MKRFIFYQYLIMSGLFSAALGWCAPPSSAPPCRNYAQMSLILNSMKEQHSDRVRLSSLAESREGRSVWVVEVGRGEAEIRRARPAMLIVAGVEGDQPAGTEAALTFLDAICEATDDAQALYNQVSIFVIPRLNPDAAERYFSAPQQEKRGNITPFDADRDGLVDEDGPDDLNGDGVITWMRIEDAKGPWIAHPQDGRILIEADAAKNEIGKWLFFREGIDNDKDEKFNEDGPGEVNFNKNFPYDYTYFEGDSGIYQVCEKETRALAEFTISHPNIGLTVTFSRNGTLLKTPESGDASESRSPQTKLRKEDAVFYDFLGEQYRSQVGITQPVDSPAGKGSFADWIYFHRGRLSLSTPVWSPEIALAMKAPEEKKENGDSSAPPEIKEASSESQINEATPEVKPIEEKKEEKKSEEKRGQVECDYLKWLDKNAPDYFMSWIPIDHPDFPGQKAEIGGFVPFAKSLPPAQFFDDVIEKHANYLTWLAGKLPRVEIYKIEVKDLGGGVFDITAKIRNVGYLPTVLAHGERVGEVFPTRVEINVAQDKVLAGEAKSRIGPLAGSGGMAEVRWILHALEGNKLKIQVISALGGSVEQEIELKGTGE